MGLFSIIAWMMNMGKIYEDFLKYLSEVKMLRNCYMYHDEEDTDSEADGEDEEE